jgi:hypothetical protein
MLDRRCPTALLVTPLATRIYRDTFANFTEASIEMIGEYETTVLLGLSAEPSSDRELETAVRRWLERLAVSWPSVLPSSTAARAPVLAYIIPAVSEGRVMSGSLG